MNKYDGNTEQENLQSPKTQGKLKLEQYESLAMSFNGTLQEFRLTNTKAYKYLANEGSTALNRLRKERKLEEISPDNLWNKIIASYPKKSQKLLAKAKEIGIEPQVRSFYRRLSPSTINTILFFVAEASPNCPDLKARFPEKTMNFILGQVYRLRDEGLLHYSDKNKRYELTEMGVSVIEKVLRFETRPKPVSL